MVHYYTRLRITGVRNPVGLSRDWRWSMTDSEWTVSGTAPATRNRDDLTASLARATSL
ncbi:MAG: hypothetical protein ACLQDY_00270 [Streptosporangiaceae bacterium]